MGGRVSGRGGRVCLGNAQAADMGLSLFWPLPVSPTFFSLFGGFRSWCAAGRRLTRVGGKGRRYHSAAVAR